MGVNPPPPPPLRGGGSPGSYHDTTKPVPRCFNRPAILRYIVEFFALVKVEAPLSMLFHLWYDRCRERKKKETLTTVTFFYYLYILLTSLWGIFGSLKSRQKSRKQIWETPWHRTNMLWPAVDLQLWLFIKLWLSCKAQTSQIHYSPHYFVNWSEMFWYL